MIMKKLLFLTILFLLVGVHSTAAQQPSETETAARRSEVKKLDKLVGHWKGRGLDYARQETHEFCRNRKRAAQARRSGVDV
jgi:hypothetical protein